MYHNCDINICFRIICQDEENCDEQHEQSWTTFFAFNGQTASTSFGKGFTATFERLLAMQSERGTRITSSVLALAVKLLEWQ